MISVCDLSSHTGALLQESGHSQECKLHCCNREGKNFTQLSGSKWVGGTESDMAELESLSRYTSKYVAPPADLKAFQKW